ncbi:MAG TPA: ATPase domain-containing protein [Verrucomicrobiae bacterium]|nr:ATPase domain-containing protein [Verrucomicrobiae bacterium]
MAQEQVHTAPVAQQKFQSTGIAGLDEILGGGFTANRLYLVEGTPGTGKTTLALQWLLSGAQSGEPGVYVCLSESREEVDEVAQSHGWDLKTITVLEAVVTDQALGGEEQFSVFQPTDVELNDTTRQMLAAVEQSRAKRLAIDSLSEMRLLAQNPYRHRQQVMALKRYFQRRGCTAMFLDDRSGGGEIDLHLQSAAHGVIQLEQRAPQYGTDHRRLRVVKLRGRDFSLGYHDFVIRRGGLDVFPRLVASDHATKAAPGRLKSGIPELDDLLGGGPRWGTSTLITGPAGTGKSSLAQSFAVAAADAGFNAAIFAFEESLPTLLARSEGLGLGIERHLQSGRITIEQVDPGQLSPGEFAGHVRAAVEGHKGKPARLIVIDSLNGYLNAMPEERFLIIQLHELMTYLGMQGVCTFLVMAQRGLLGTATMSPLETTYLTDNALLLRFFEAMGEIRVALAAIKMRSAKHERSIREYLLGQPRGIRIGKPLREFQGVLTGEPTFIGEQRSLLDPAASVRESLPEG